MRVLRFRIYPTIYWIQIFSFKAPFLSVKQRKSTYRLSQEELSNVKLSWHMVGDQQMSLPFPSAYSFLSYTSMPVPPFRGKHQRYGLQWSCTVHHILSLNSGKYIINILQNGNKPTICHKLNNVWVWRFFTNFLKFQPHLQKNRLKYLMFL